MFLFVTKYNFLLIFGRNIECFGKNLQTINPFQNQAILCTCASFKSLSLLRCWMEYCCHFCDGSARYQPVVDRLSDANIIGYRWVLTNFLSIPCTWSASCRLPYWIDEVRPCNLRKPTTELYFLVLFYFILRHRCCRLNLVI